MSKTRRAHSVNYICVIAWVLQSLENIKSEDSNTLKIENPKMSKSVKFLILDSKYFIKFMALDFLDLDFTLDPKIL